MSCLLSYLEDPSDYIEKAEVQVPTSLNLPPTTVLARTVRDIYMRLFHEEKEAGESTEQVCSREEREETNEERAKRQKISKSEELDNLLAEKKVVATPRLLRGHFVKIFKAQIGFKDG